MVLGISLFKKPPDNMSGSMLQPLIQSHSHHNHSFDSASHNGPVGGAREHARWCYWWPARMSRQSRLCHLLGCHHHLRHERYGCGQILQRRVRKLVHRSVDMWLLHPRASHSEWLYFAMERVQEMPASSSRSTKAAATGCSCHFHPMASSLDPISPESHWWPRLNVCEWPSETKKVSSHLRVVDCESRRKLRQCSGSEE